MMTTQQIQMERNRQIDRCQAICKVLNEEREGRFTYRYDVCESGFTEFYFKLNDGSEHLLKKVKNEFLDTDDSKDLSHCTPTREQLVMWDLMGLLKKSRIKYEF